jgi:hypothetical protein
LQDISATLPQTRGPCFGRCLSKNLCVWSLVLPWKVHHFSSPATRNLKSELRSHRYAVSASGSDIIDMSTGTLNRTLKIPEAHERPRNCVSKKTAIPPLLGIAYFLDVPWLPQGSGGTGPSRRGRSTHSRVAAPQGDAWARSDLHPPIPSWHLKTPQSCASLRSRSLGSGPASRAILKKGPFRCWRSLPPQFASCRQ